MGYPDIVGSQDPGNRLRGASDVVSEAVITGLGSSVSLSSVVSVSSVFLCVLHLMKSGS